MTKFPFALALLSVLLLPSISVAQGRGGYGGGGGRSRGRDDQSDSTARAPRVQQSLADVVYAHRADLQLTDSQTTRVANIRMIAVSRRMVLERQVDSLRSVMTVSPGDVAVPPTDSSRTLTIQHRRSLAAVLGQLHDVDLDSRNQTLMLLSSAQQKKAEELELAANAPPVQRGAPAEGGRSSGGRRGGGMGGGNGVPFA